LSSIPDKIKVGGALKNFEWKIKISPSDTNSANVHYKNWNLI